MSARRYGLRRVFAVVACGAVAVLAAACSSSVKGNGGGGGTGATNGGAVTTLSFLTEGSAAQWVGMAYGIKNGYYTKEGIKLDFHFGTGSGPTGQAIAAGKTDIGDPSLATIAQIDSSGGDLVAIGWHMGQTGLGLFCDSKLGITQPAQLKGHKIVVAPGGTAALVLPAVLKAGGLTEKDVTIQSVASNVQVSTFASGSGDCLGSNLSQQPAFQDKRPTTPMLFDDIGVAVPGYAFTVTKSFLASHKDALKRFLRATYAAQADAIKNPDDAAAAFVAIDPGFPLDQAKSQGAATNRTYCTKTMVAQSASFGTLIDSDWTTGLETVRGFSKVPASLNAADLYTTELFDSSVSTSKCSAEFTS